MKKAIDSVVERAPTAYREYWRVQSSANQLSEERANIFPVLKQLTEEAQNMQHHAYDTGYQDELGALFGAKLGKEWLYR